jgi:hypothetical protein
MLVQKIFLKIKISTPNFEANVPLATIKIVSKPEKKVNKISIVYEKLGIYIPSFF